MIEKNQLWDIKMFGKAAASEMWNPIDFVPVPLSEVRESVEDEEPCWYDLYDDRMFCGSEDEPSY